MFVERFNETFLMIASNMELMVCISYCTQLIGVIVLMRIFKTAYFLINVKTVALASAYVVFCKLRYSQSKFMQALVSSYDLRINQFIYGSRFIPAGFKTVFVNLRATPVLPVSPHPDDFFKSSSPGKRILSPIKRKMLPDPDEDVSTYLTFAPCTYSTAIKITIMEPPETLSRKRCHDSNEIDDTSDGPSSTHDISGTPKFYFHGDGASVDQRTLFKLRTKLLRCNDCHNSASLLMCLQCPNVGCLNSGHALEHASTSGHIFGISTSSGHMMCLKCKEVVGDPELERIRVMSLKFSGILSTYPGMPVLDCEHNTEKEKIMNRQSREPTFKASKGLKGFINMGSTCFMSSILQAMVHNPFIRDYYLSGSHLDCTKGMEYCISCCVGEIFKDFYTSTSTAGFGPSSLLSAAWKMKKSLAGYSEQDAHEFWQFLIHQLHKNDTKCSKVREPTPSLDSDWEERSLVSNPLFNCDCITHRTFAGELQSTLRCTECGGERVTVDPMLDLSLEIQEKREPLKNIDECLRKFTKQERLDIMHQCPKCGKKTGVMKQLKIRKLPPTLCIQLKRFEHVAVSTKIDAHIDVPLLLDMSKYTLDGKRNGDSGSDLYELYAVVYHIGSVNTGHYISLVKDRDGMWFKFDDAHVIRISEKDVLSAQAYLLFYVIHEMP
ncbi:hypothetical protein FOA43_001635 [Brettanomyces nanus]|uniref:Ubiquitin carboxyl-terminal hydrolase n=1 Tax=Eeniella nana TaxID=13502 RepID=A0A875S008_EENNA|nr:uncharacterized protein FOA43_001635 [Brettanomyces nanus]QPG74308.1 hypothetical protein FOA43_001635 [Brettanomyces nanus]